MDQSTRIAAVLVGVQVTLFGVLMAVVAASGLQYWPPQVAIVVAAAGFAVSVPALVIGRRPNG